MQLQKSPIGILGAFALKVLGRNPQLFSEAVTPTVDVYDQYLATSELSVKATSANVNLATFNTSAFVVPNGKCWRLMALGGSFGPNVADIAIHRRLTFSLTGPGNANAVNIGGGADDTGALASSYGFTLRPPIFLPPGWTVAVGLINSAAWTVAVPFNAAILVQEFDT